MASPTSRRPAPGRRSSRTRRRWTTRRPLAATLAELLDGDAADYEAALAGAGRTTDGQVVVGSPGERRVRGPPSRTRSTTAGWPACRSSTCRASRSRRRPGSRSSTRPRPTCRRPSSSRAAPTAWRWSPASTTRSCTSTSGPADAPTYVVIAVGGDSAADGPVTLGGHPLARPRDLGRLRRRQPAGPHPRPGPRARPVRPATHGRSTSSSRTAMPAPSTPTPPCPTASCRLPGSSTSSRST